MKPIQKVLAVGRGAVGSLYGSLLFEHLGKDDFAFVVDEGRKEAYESSPLMINGKPVDFPLVSKEDADWGKADLVLFFTKYGALEGAMEEAAPFIDEHTILMSGINGIVSEDDLKERFPENTVIRTIAQKMDSRYVDNTVHFTQKGELVFGLEDPAQKEQMDAVAALFDACGLPYVISGDIVLDQWNKLMCNCGLNQVSAVMDATYGKILNDPASYDLFVKAMEEVKAVANAMGISITQDHLNAWIESLKTYNPDSMPSMRQDMLAGRKTEKALFSGTVLPLAARHGIEAPTLQLLWDGLVEIDEKADN